MRVLAFPKYGRKAASTRQRLLQYLPALRDAGIHVDWFPLLDDDYVRRLASGERQRHLSLAAAYARRLRQLGRAADYDLLWVYAELFPYLPGEFEKLAFRSGKPVVCDWDDAFFQPYAEHHSPLVRRLLGRKLQPLLSGAAACCCGNDYLRDHAARFCSNSILLPTIVDTELYQPTPQPQRDGPPVIGWIGSPSTWRYLRPLLPLLRSLCAAGLARVRVIGAGQGARADGFAGLDLVDWSEDREVAEVQRMDIGIMPLPDGPFERGKSGYKLVQYMACGLPVVASPVGVNREMVSEGVNGFLATSEAEWRNVLTRLLANAELRGRMGQEGRRIAVERYSLRAHAPRLVGLLRSLADR